MNELAESLSTLSARFAASSPPAGAGVLAAGTVELAAGLCESILLESLDVTLDARGLGIQARTLRSRARAAGFADAIAYRRARETLVRPPRPGETGRDAALRAELMAAAEAALDVAAVAGDCAALGAELARVCPPEWRPDAAGAAELAAACVRAAALLVEVNLALLPEDERRERARAIVVAAEAELERARRALRDS